MSTRKRISLLLPALVATLVVALPAAASASSFLGRFSTQTLLSPTAPTSGPAMGDVNPYGVAVAPVSKGKLKRGDVLVSNFNNSMNQQGTGSSIVEISPSGAFTVFAVVPQPTSTAAVGLTTALVALKSGYVVVGSLPAPGGKSANARAGALSILNWNGNVVLTIKGGDIKGPWDMTALDHGSNVELFVTNLLNGTVAAKGNNVKRGTVVRISLKILPGYAPQVLSNQVIANGFTEHTDPNALVVGPTGVGLGHNGTLYVADSANNRIAKIPDATTRTSVLHGGGITFATGGPINDPLGLAVAPNGHVIIANGADGNMVEADASGIVTTKTLVPNGGGDLFGLAIAPAGKGIYYVNDIGMGPDANSLELLH